mmetsp:Transcript_26330/g.49129  ORF Transcript_26330/g.49129 Transcript_26330/m.49129 type:complete len:100 (-) Transcript_26330:665-964(-)
MATITPAAAAALTHNILECNISTGRSLKFIPKKKHQFLVILGEVCISRMNLASQEAKELICVIVKALVALRQASTLEAHGTLGQVTELIVCILRVSYHF